MTGPGSAAACREIDASAAAGLLRDADDILILCHRKPDGDTLGCGFAMLHALRALGKRARVFCADGFGARYAFLYPEGFGEKTQPEFPPRFLLAVDIASEQLFGRAGECWAGRVDLCIDHHPSNTRYARHLLLNPDAAATAEEAAGVIAALGVPLTGAIATCLYTGLSTDTGCFRYANTTARSHRLAARLIEAGARHRLVDKLMFETRSPARIEIERRALDSLCYACGGRVAAVTVTREDLLRSGADEDDLEGIAGLARSIEGVEAAITLREQEDGSIRVSLRSGDAVDVSAVCARFGGGGHARAAGCTLPGPAGAAKTRLVAAVERALGDAGDAKGTGKK